MFPDSKYHDGCLHKSEVVITVIIRNQDHIEEINNHTQVAKGWEEHSHCRPLQGSLQLQMASGKLCPASYTLVFRHICTTILHQAPLNPIFSISLKNLQQLLSSPSISFLGGHWGSDGGWPLEKNDSTAQSLTIALGTAWTSDPRSFQETQYIYILILTLHPQESLWQHLIKKWKNKKKKHYSFFSEG